MVKDIERLSLKEGIRAVYGGGGAVSPVIAAKILNRLRSQEELASAEPSSPLSHTQLEILRLIAVGFSNREIAGRIHLSG
jgi:DNA-binding NarL/FixJ family response regulator